MKMVIRFAAIASLAWATHAQATTLFTSKASFLAASPSSVLIEDFESVPAGVRNTNLAQLVRTSGIYTPTGGTANVVVTSPGFTNFGPGNNPTTSQILTSSDNEDFVGMLAAPALSLGFDVYLNDLGPATAKFYNGATLLGTVAFAADASSANNFAFAGITGAGPITSFRWTGTLGGRVNTGVDNILSTQSGSVPEPAAWALMLVGFGGLGAVLRRRRALAIA